MMNEAGLAVQALSKSNSTIPGGRSTFGLRMDPDYRGPLAGKAPEEAAYILGEALDYFALPYVDRPQVPFDHGYGVTTLRDHPQASEAYQIVAVMLREMTEGKPRAVKAGWTELIRLFNEAQAAGMRLQAASEIEVDRRRVRVAPKSRVYFIGGSDGPVKIGKAIRPEKRVRELQTGHHQKLYVIATRLGGLALEAQYHQRFASARLHGEWFERTPEIEAEIARLGGHTA